jgi:hypothetical protein
MSDPSDLGVSMREQVAIAGCVRQVQCSAFLTTGSASQADVLLAQRTVVPLHPPGPAILLELVCGGALTKKANVLDSYRRNDL